jgi:hypothetical protein
MGDIIFDDFTCRYPLPENLQNQIDIKNNNKNNNLEILTPTSVDSSLDFIPNDIPRICSSPILEVFVFFEFYLNEC